MSSIYSLLVGAIQGLGTGVATALGVNTGSAGAVVVNGGALGTPSSGVLTNCTSVPAGGLRFKVKSESRDLTVAAGSVAYTGAGFTPKGVFCFGTDTSAAASNAFGASDGTTHLVLHNYTSPAIDSFLIYAGSGGNFQTAVVASLDADGCTLTWAKTGAPGGTHSFVLVYVG